MKNAAPVAVPPPASRLAPPRASAMIEALRGLGYSTATALADIIDNSISAQARSVALGFAWAGEASHVAILDDGLGMDAEEAGCRDASRRAQPARPRAQAISAASASASRRHPSRNAGG